MINKLRLKDEISLIRSDTLFCDQKLSENYIDNFIKYGIRRDVNTISLRFLKRISEYQIIDQVNFEVSKLEDQYCNDLPIDITGQLGALIKLEVFRKITNILQLVYDKKA